MVSAWDTWKEQHPAAENNRPFLAQLYKGIHINQWYMTMGFVRDYQQNGHEAEGLSE
jgi:hypothetical protein